MEENIKDESCGKKCEERKGTSEECEKKVGKFLSLQRRCNTVWSEKEVLRNNLFQRERGDTETGGVSQIAYLLAKYLKFWVHKWAQGVHTDKYVNTQWKEKKKISGGTSVKLDTLREPRRSRSGVAAFWVQANGSDR